MGEGSDKKTGRGALTDKETVEEKRKKHSHTDREGRERYQGEYKYAQRDREQIGKREEQEKSRAERLRRVKK